MSVEKAQGILYEEGFDHEINGEQTFFDDYNCRVTGQDPAAGTDGGDAPKREYSTKPTVELACKKPVPNVAGQDQYDADANLGAAGFQSRIVSPSWYGTAESCRVRRQGKKGLAKPGTRIPLLLKCKKTEPLPEEPLPPEEDISLPEEDGGPDDLPAAPSGGEDVDCDDIGHPVRVGPGDPHRLDRDGDGEGCEWE